MIKHLLLTPVIFALVATVAVAPAASPYGQQPRERAGIVVGVLAGDTLLVRTGEEPAERVRLVGLRAGSCYERQSLAETQKLALGHRVLLVKDPSQGIRAADGALLAYVRLPRGSDLGALLVKGGFATVSYQEPFALLRSYRLGQIAAQLHKRGLWSSACSDLSLSLHASPSPVTLGNKLTYQLRLQNNRPHPTHVSVKLEFSAPVTVATEEPGCRSSGSGEVLCELALESRGRFASATRASPARSAIPPPPPGSYTAYLSASPTVPGPLTLRAEASAPKPDATPEDNSTVVTTSVQPGPASADLKLTMSSDPQPAQAGGLLTLTTTVTNLGPSEATGVVISDPIPAGVEAPYGIGCSPCLGGLRTGELAAGQSATENILVFHSPSTPITNSASVTASTPDPNTGNNSASITTEPQPAPPSPTLGLVVTTTSASVRVGQQFAYVLTVKNTGSVPASGVELRNSVDPGDGAELLAVRPSQGSCDRDLACKLGTLEARAEATVMLSYRARHVGPGTFYESAFAESAAGPNPGTGFVSGPFANASIAILPAVPPTFLVGPDQIGMLHLGAKTSPTDANDAFGRSAARTYGEFCTLTWPYGLSIHFADFADEDPCGFSGRSHLVSATMRGRRWTTSAGLRIGDSVGRIHQRYPQAERHRNSYWLVAARSRDGTRQARLAAIVWDGRVQAFTVNR